MPFGTELKLHVMYGYVMVIKKKDYVIEFLYFKGKEKNYIRDDLKCERSHDQMPFGTELKLHVMHGYVMVIKNGYVMVFFAKTVMLWFRGWSK